jgi:signal transduction histidine kinase
VASSSVADFIAHEVRNNIAIMMGFAELLGAGFDAMAADDRASVVQAIESEGEHALAVLDSLLKLVESRRHPEAAGTSVPLHSVVRRVIAEHKRRHPSRHLQVTGDGLVFANGNSSWIQIAVANLVSNAEKVTPEDQIIEVNVRQEAERALVTVLDKGNALAPPLYQDLWEIYSKGAPRGIEISGSGIGLSLCKELVAAMGGKVWAGPRSQGGSGFAISLNGRPQPSVSEIEMR